MTDVLKIEKMMHPVYVIKYLLLVVGFSANAECIRWQPDANKNITPQFDGPGSWGALHETVTLDCLKYIGSIKDDSKVVMLVKDEKGVIHHLRMGDFMGENSGKIVGITETTIIVDQVVRVNGEWEVRRVNFPK